MNIVWSSPRPFRRGSCVDERPLSMFLDMHQVCARLARRKRLARRQGENDARAERSSSTFILEIVDEQIQEMWHGSTELAVWMLVLWRARSGAGACSGR